MSGGTGSSTSSTTVTPVYPNQSSIDALMAEASNVYQSNTGKIQPYPGAVPVAPSSATQQGQQSTLNAAGALQNTVLPGATSAAQFGLSDVLYPHSNPALQASIDAAIRPITQAYLDPGGVLSQIRSDAVGAGQYGGSRMGLAQGVAGGRYLNTIGDIAATRTSAAYDKGLDTFSRTLGMIPDLAKLYALPGTLQSAVGTQQEGYVQAQNDYDAASRLWGINAPWQNLSNYASLLYGGSIPGTSTSSTTTAQAPSDTMAGTGGALLGFDIAKQTGIVDPVIGAGLGLLLGLFA